MKLKKYRIVKDRYCGYEAQVWRFWFPFWCQMQFSNTHQTIEEAEEFIRKKGVVKHVEL